MLTTLRIKNLALVADLTLELQPGLNVISGETGAGKSSSSVHSTSSWANAPTAPSSAAAVRAARWKPSSTCPGSRLP